MLQSRVSTSSANPTPLILTTIFSLKFLTHYSLLFQSPLTDKSL